MRPRKRHQSTVECLTKRVGLWMRLQRGINNGTDRAEQVADTVLKFADQQLVLQPVAAVCQHQSTKFSEGIGHPEVAALQACLGWVSDHKGSERHTVDVGGRNGNERLQAMLES